MESKELMEAAGGEMGLNSESENRFGGESGDYLW